ncbi:hypothetical protein B0H14DRAFT_1331921 [Mycena olivaceomarginata]|nr:hypothetical protein B0H14DRAFT_1331921 [Mycena olivaceomarginata]
MPTVEPVVASAKATLTAFDKSYKDADKKIAEHSEEFFGVRNLDEAQVYFSTLPAVHHHRLVEKLVGMAVEGTDADVQLVAELLTRAVSKDLCSIDALKDGFRLLIKILTIDALTAPEKMTNMVGMVKAARPDPKTSITRSDIWYEDGSVVLQAQHTQFRVHWGVLARQSSFFHDMQGLPQPPDQPSVDGCPVVKLPDDIADVECLLKALYSPTFLAQAALPLPAIGALIGWDASTISAICWIRPSGVWSLKTRRP